MTRIPIRIRIALLAAVAGALVALVVGGVLLARSSSTIRDDFDASLVEEAAETLIAVRNGLMLSTFTHPGSTYGSLLSGVFDGSGDLIDASEPNLPAIPPVLEIGRLTTITDDRSDHDYRALALNIPESTDLTLVVMNSVSPIDHRIDDLTRNVWVITLVAIGAVGLAGYLITGAVLRPIVGLAQSAASLGRDPSGQRLDLPPAKDEVRDLAETLNASLGRIDELMEAQRRFVTDASHELRTPLARLRADIDLARRPTRTREEIAEALSQIDDHAVHLTSLADSLLGLLAPAGDEPRRPDSTTAGEILADVRARTPVIEGITFEIPGEVSESVLLCDAHGVVGSLVNLVENAVRHGVPPVEVSALRYDEGLEFSVRDHGAGIPAELRETVLEPFSQGPHAVGGTGLGLAIVSKFADNQGGALLIEDGFPGCRMLLRIPFSPLQDSF